MKQIFTAFLFIVFATSGFSQGNTDPYQNRLILKKYKVADLQTMQSGYYEKFKQVKYYYIYSFFITDLSCESCPDYVAELIDVDDYNHLRQPNTRVTITDNTYGFSITLLSQRELDILIMNDGPIPPANTGDR
ncbi:MAG: hypothetical protein ACOZCO_00010 [Bacteroidota bacterium]